MSRRILRNILSHVGTGCTKGTTTTPVCTQKKRIIEKTYSSFRETRIPTVLSNDVSIIITTTRCQSARRKENNWSRDARAVGTLRAELHGAPYCHSICLGIHAFCYGQPLPAISKGRRLSLLPACGSRTHIHAHAIKICNYTSGTTVWCGAAGVLQLAGVDVTAKQGPPRHLPKVDKGVREPRQKHHTNPTLV